MSSTPTTPMSATPARPPARPAATSSAPSARVTSVKSLARSVLISLGFGLVALLIAGVAFAWVWPAFVAGELALWGALAMFMVPLLVVAMIIVAVNEKVVPSKVARGVIVAVLVIGAFVLGGFAFLHGWFVAMTMQKGLPIGMAASVVGGFLAITALFEVRRRMKH